MRLRTLPVVILGNGSHRQDLLPSAATFIFIKETHEKKAKQEARQRLRRLWIYGLPYLMEWLRYCTSRTVFRFRNCPTQITGPTSWLAYLLTIMYNRIDSQVVNPHTLTGQRSFFFSKWKIFSLHDSIMLSLIKSDLYAALHVKASIITNPINIQNQ